jgi:hypothetical protein
MTSIPPIVGETERFVRLLAAQLTRPRNKECLCCYVARLLDEYPCDGSLRHAYRYRDAVAPRATALGDRLSRVGGWCDCEIFLNGYRPRAVLPDDDAESGVIALPPCQGVRRGSVQPCGNWTRIRRW